MRLVLLFVLLFLICWFDVRNFATGTVYKSLVYVSIAQPEPWLLYRLQGCIVKVARRAVLQRSVPQLHRRHLWLLQCHVDSLSPHLWQVICLSALAAIHMGRRQLWAAYVAAGRPADAQLQPILRDASAMAVQSFWKALLGFAERDTLPQGWDLAGAEEHPFICRRPLEDPLFSSRPLRVSVPPFM